MRLTFISILFYLSFFNVYGQSDYIRKLYVEAENYFKTGQCDSAINTYSKIIQADSSYYKIYYNRGWLLLYAYGNRNCDSAKIEQGIKDFIKCIQLYNSNPKTFPDDCVFKKVKKYKIPKPSDNVDIGLIYLSYPYEFISTGVIYYITHNGRKKKFACEYWEKALDVKMYLNDILLKEFCR